MEISPSSDYSQNSQLAARKQEFKQVRLDFGGGCAPKQFVAEKKLEKPNISTI